MERRRAKLAALKPYQRNPRTHTPQQVERVAALMREYGQMQDIVVDEDMMILAGHARAKAAAQLGWAEVDVRIRRGLTPAQKRGYVIGDNQVALLAGWDEDLLRLELGELERLDFDLELTGFDPDALVSYLAGRAEPAPPGEFAEYGEGIETDHKCPKCGYRWSGEE